MANGIPRMLYRHAQRRFRLIVEKILRDRWRAATTSSRSERIKTISAASIATVVPDESAMPTEAATRAGESLIPSPTWIEYRQFTRKTRREKGPNEPSRRYPPVQSFP